MDLDVCGILAIEFEHLRLDMRRLQSEVDDLGKIIECVYSTAPYDQVKQFASKLHILCDTLKYMAELLPEMHRYGPEAWRHPPLPKSNLTMQDQLTRREEALEYYRHQYEKFGCEDGEDEIRC